MRDEIYFAAGAGRVKIGTTSRGTAARLKDINAHLAEPLELLGSINGGLKLERAIQQYLIAWRIKGEWFKDCADTREIIERIIAVGPAAAGIPENILTITDAKHESYPVSSDPGKLGRVAAVMWPYTAAKELAALGETDELTSIGWLTGEAVPPRLVRYAFAGALGEFLMRRDGDPEITFLGPVNEGSPKTARVDRE